MGAEGTPEAHRWQPPAPNMQLTRPHEAIHSKPWGTSQGERATNKRNNRLGTTQRAQNQTHTSPSPSGQSFPVLHRTHQIPPYLCILCAQVDVVSISTPHAQCHLALVLCLLPISLHHRLLCHSMYLQHIHNAVCRSVALKDFLRFVLTAG